MPKFKPRPSSIFAAFFLALVLSLLSVAHAPKSLAISGSDFQAGHIIDDVIFLNNNSMSAADIQNFLNAKVPVCDTNGTQQSEYGGGTRAQYSASHNPPYYPPFTCLKDYSTSVPAMAADSYCSAIGASASMTAAQVIKTVSDACIINPQVMVVLLQKEQGLVTDTWPWSNQYQFATGYCVYDTTPPPSCAGTDGFFNQIYYAARQFKKYLANSGAPGVYWIGNYRIPYNPDGSCGSSIVNIQNGATAALYDYTPYQPNSAALAGVSDSSPGGTVTCGAYGNRNFWWYFNEWFGSSLGEPYNWGFLASSSWSVNLDYGQTSQVTIRVKNMGTRTWYADGSAPPGFHPTRLIIDGYHLSPFADMSDSNWISPGQIRMTESSVPSGGTATFSFRVKAPNSQVTSIQNYEPVIDGIYAMPPKSIIFTYTSNPPSFQPVSSTSQSFVPSPNSQFTGSVVIKNTSNSTWYADGSTPAGIRPIRLVTSGYQTIEFADPTDSDWVSPAQIRMTPASVAPGSNATFTFRMNAPAAKKVGHIYTLIPTMDGISSLSGPATTIHIDVPQPVISFSPVSVPASVNLTAGTPQTVTVKVKNTGNFVWRNESTKSAFSPTRLATDSPFYRPSSVYTNDGTWLAPSQVGMEEPVVNPGDTATFQFTATSNTVGTKQEPFALLVDGRAGLSTTLGNIQFVTSP